MVAEVFFPPNQEAAELLLPLLPSNVFFPDWDVWQDSKRRYLESWLCCKSPFSYSSFHSYSYNCCGPAPFC